jgi:CRP-like cAMP-binding protein
VVVPNAVLLQSAFLLLGRRNGTATPRRVHVRFHADFEHPPATVCAAVRDALSASPIPEVTAAPPLEVVCLDLGSSDRPSMAAYDVRFGVATPELEDAAASVVRGHVHAALRRAGIPLARPAATLFTHVEDPSTEHERASRHRDRALVALRALELFRALTDEELRHLAGQLRYAPFDAGEVLTRQGAVAHWLYVVESGRVEVVTEVEGRQRMVYRLEGPEVFGEMGLMTGEPRMASVIALGPVVCHRLEKAAFERILRERPELAAGFAEILAHRRVQLLEVRAALGAEGREVREESERARILERIRAFFGLG